MKMNNEFLQRLQNRIVDSRKKQTISDFVCEKTTLREGVKFSFKGHKFQKAIMDDTSEEMFVIKPSQCGCSEVQIRKAIAMMVMNPGSHIMYTYPDLMLKKANAQTRISPLINRDFPTPKGENWIRNMDVIQIGDSFLYLAANSESAATSLALNGVFNDEVDLSDQEFLALVLSRLQHSEKKIRQGFSTPTFENFGISKDFSTTNQMEYLVKCPHCGKWQLPEYDLKWVHIPNLPSTVENLITDIDSTLASKLDLDNAYVKCDKCGGRLDLGDSAVREWVAKYPERINSHGYRINCFSSELLPIKYLATTIANYAKRDQLRRAYNVLLGIPYKSNATRLEPGDIIACMKDERLQSVSKDIKCFMGLDVGSTCTCVISTQDNKLIHFETIPFDRVLERYKELKEMYNIVAGMVDRHPMISLANDLRDLSENTIMPVIYTGASKNSLEPHKDIYGNIDYYNINRTSALDRVRDLVNTHKLEMYGYGLQKNIILTHFTDNWRDPCLESGGEPKWRKLTGEDHYLHSSSYSLLSQKLYDYVNSSSESDNRFCLGISGPSASISDSQNKTLYNDNLLQYSKDIGKQKVKRLR